MTEGIDDRAVSAWIASNVQALTAPFTFELIAGGRSNLTYRVTDSVGNTAALRRPPMGHVLPTAHDMTREHTVIHALEQTAVPVPRTLGLCADASVNGAPFYLMSFVEGHILRDHDSAQSLSEAVRAQASKSVILALAELHSVDIDAIGLGEFARRDGYITRQLNRWSRQYAESTLDGVGGPTSIVRAYELLAKQVPDQQGSSIVHGDFRLDNAVIDGGGDVVAILDWEICTMGDPLADLGLLMVYWVEDGENDMVLSTLSPTTLPGFASRADLVARYAAATGRDVSSVPYYRAFGLWKLACILQGVHVRYASGSAAGDRSDADQFGAHVIRMGERALHAAESL